MYENNKKIKSVPMSIINAQLVYWGEQYAEDAAENWVMGYYQGDI